MSRWPEAICGRSWAQIQRCSLKYRQKYKEDLCERVVDETTGLPHRKYIIRTDLMFTRTPRLLRTEKDHEAYEALLEARELECKQGATKEELERAVAMYRKAIRLSPTIADTYGL